MLEIEMVKFYRSLDEASKKRYFSLVETAAKGSISNQELEELVRQDKLIFKELSHVFSLSRKQTQS